MPRRLLNGVLDAIFPRECLSCGRANPRGALAYLCADCLKGVSFINGGACLKCGEILGPSSAPFASSCASCAENPPRFGSARAACLFDGGARDLILALKYEGGLYALSDIAKLADFCPSLADYLGGAVFVPVPLHKSRQRRRKYNQSERIAAVLAGKFAHLGASFSDILERRRATQTQTALDKSRRAENVRGAFALKKRAKFPPKNARLVLVDDVITTGATMSECARVLRRSGYENVDAFAALKRL